MNHPPRKRKRVDDETVARARESRRAVVYAAYEDAARDPDFVSEMREIADAFDGALLDGFEDDE